MWDPASVLVNGKGHFDCENNVFYSCDACFTGDGEGLLCANAEGAQVSSPNFKFPEDPALPEACH